MKLDKKLAKLLTEHELSQVVEQLIAQVGLPKVLMQISNRLVLKGGKDKTASKIWLKRAKVIHAVMEEIEKEEPEQRLIRDAFAIFDE